MKNISHTLRFQFNDLKHSGLSYSLDKSLNILESTTPGNRDVLIDLHTKLMSNVYGNIFVTLLDHQVLKSR